jgi:general stress protein 26
MKPIPEPIEPEQILTQALAVLNDDPFPNLASIDGDQPRVRPVSPVRTVGFTAFVANLRAYHKTVEIQANPKVELCYMNEHHNQVRITGIANVVTDKALIKDIWLNHNLLRAFLADPFDPNLIIYQIDPTQVRFMQEWALKYHEVPFDRAPQP